MEVVAGGMIGASGSKWQLTLRYDGTHYYLVSMLHLYWGRQIVRVRHFVHSAEDPIVPGHSAHWLTYFLSLREQQCNPFKSLPGWHTAVALSCNKGACILPGNCGYRHVCISCQQQHKARDCPTTPDTSFYKQGIPARVSTSQPATRS